MNEYAVRVLFVKEMEGSARHGFLKRQRNLMHRKVRSDFFVDRFLYLPLLILGQFPRKGKVKPKPFRRDVASLLLNLASQNIAERLMKKMSRRVISNGLAARIGKPSPIVEAMQGLPIAGPVARMAERSPTVRGIAEGIEASNVPATTAAAGVMVPSATLTPGDIGEGYDWTPGGFPEHGDTKFDNGETDLNDFFMKDDNGDPELEQFFDPRTDEDMDKFFSPAYSESEVDRIAAAIWQQESSGRLRRPDGRQIISPSGAVGPMQIMPGTFRQYAKAGEDIYDADDNLAVGRRLIADLHGKYGDPRKVAAAYFSGKPNYNASASDVTGKTTASYVADVMNRMERGNANG